MDRNTKFLYMDFSSNPTYGIPYTVVPESKTKVLMTFDYAKRVNLTALKKYGMFVGDNGSDWFITGATDSSWDDQDLNQLKAVPGNAFEVVQAGVIIK